MSNMKAIQTFVRERPTNGRDGQMDPPSLELDEVARTAKAFSDRGNAFEIKLSGCLGPQRGQEEVWDSISPIIEEASKGVNATVFAYGVTGSGKTHTIQGTDSEPGIIPRVVEAAFDIPTVDGMKMSYVEILKDEVYDLMSAKQAKLDIRFDGTNNIIAGMTTEPVESVNHFHELFTESVMRRKTESTNLNSQSSRSHAILMLDLEMTDPQTGRRICSKLRLIDLAGSENNRLTGNNKERTQESAAINKSLTTLGNVIDAINRGDSRIPYRDCKLTRILSDVLGGENRGIMICCMAPGSKFAKDTYNTLDFAQRASGLKTRTTSFQPRVSSASFRPSLPALGTGRIRSSIKIYEQPVSTVRAPLRPVSNGVGSGTRAQALGKGVSTLTKADIEALINSQVGIHLAPLVQRNNELEPRMAELETANAQLQERLDQVEQAAALEPELTPEEKEMRARVCTNKARQAVEQHDYRSAKLLYEKALEYQPGHERLILRITEMAMLMEGHLSRPDASMASTLAPPVKRSRALDPIGESGADYDGSKRLRTEH